MNSDQLFRMLILAGLAVVLPIMGFHRLKARTDEPLDRKQEGLFILATLRPMGAVMFIALAVYLSRPSRMAWSSMPLPVWLRWCGVAMIFADGALLLWTLRSLGTNLTDTVVTRKVHTLVVKGPYRWMRHPFYDAVAVLLLGIALAAANWLLLVSGAIVFSLLAIRSAREEAHLVARFGNDYRRYMARTNRFVPSLRSWR
jgi:protein-S-isoprenylcysteine O-methyltransferase Ste14